MAEVTEREFKKLEAAAAYYRREHAAMVESAAGARVKAERAAADLAAAEAGVPAADAAVEAALAAIAAADLAVAEAVIIVPDLDDDAPPAVGAAAGDATIRIENGD